MATQRGKDVVPSKVRLTSSTQIQERMWKGPPDQSSWRTEGEADCRCEQFNEVDKLENAQLKDGGHR